MVACALALNAALIIYFQIAADSALTGGDSQVVNTMDTDQIKTRKEASGSGSGNAVDGGEARGNSKAVEAKSAGEKDAAKKAAAKKAAAKKGAEGSAKHAVVGGEGEGGGSSSAAVAVEGAGDKATAEEAAAVARVAHEAELAAAATKKNAAEGQAAAEKKAADDKAAAEKKAASDNSAAEKKAAEDKAAAEKATAELKAAREKTQAELVPLKVSELKKRGRELGIDQDKLDRADDEQDTRGVVIELILEQQRWLSAEERAAKDKKEADDKAAAEAAAEKKAALEAAEAKKAHDELVAIQKGQIASYLTKSEDKLRQLGLDMPTEKEKAGYSSIDCQWRWEEDPNFGKVWEKNFPAWFRNSDWSFFYRKDSVTHHCVGNDWEGYLVSGDQWIRAYPFGDFLFDPRFDGDKSIPDFGLTIMNLLDRGRSLQSSEGRTGSRYPECDYDNGSPGVPHIGPNGMCHWTGGRRWSGPDSALECLDIYPPAFTYSEQYAVDFPDEFNRMNLGYRDYDKEIAEIEDAGKSPPKTNKAGWRGTWHEPLPARQALKAACMAEPNRTDCGLVMNEDGSFPYLSMVGQVATHKYLIDVEGFGASERIPIYAFSKRPMLIMDRPMLSIDYALIQPWVHYVPLKRDASDLTQKLDWLEANPDEAKAIAERNYALAKANFTSAAARAQARLVLMKLGSGVPHHVAQKMAERDMRCKFSPDAEYCMSRLPPCNDTNQMNCKKVNSIPNNYFQTPMSASMLGVLPTGVAVDGTHPPAYDKVNGQACDCKGCPGCESIRNAANHSWQHCAKEGEVCQINEGSWCQARIRIVGTGTYTIMLYGGDSFTCEPASFVTNPAPNSDKPKVCEIATVPGCFTCARGGR